MKITHAGEAIMEIFEVTGFSDILASDLTKLSMHLRPTAFNMAMQVSKYTALGIPLAKVIELCTIAPAKHMGMADTIGSLSVGHAADVAVFRPIKKDNIFGDRPNGSDEQDKPVIYQDAHGIAFGSIKSADRVYLFGPMPFKSLSRTEVNDYCQFYQIKAGNEKLAHSFTMGQIIAVTELAAEIITGKSYSDKDLIVSNDLFLLDDEKMRHERMHPLRRAARRTAALQALNSEDAVGGRL